MTTYIRRLGFVSVVCVGLFVIAATLFDLVDPVKTNFYENGEVVKTIISDPYQLWRYGLLKLGALCIGLPAMAAFWILLDWLTPGTWFSEEQTVEQKTVILVGLVLAVVWLLVAN
jgi:hypothetical protein